MHSKSGDSDVLVILFIHILSKQQKIKDSLPTWFKTKKNVYQIQLIFLATQ
jgi:hypothetical protein